MALLKNKYVQLITAFVIYSFVAVMAKMAAMSTTPVQWLLWVGMEVLVLGVYALLWQQVLKKFSLITAMSCKGLVVVISLVWAVVFFHEAIQLNHLIGAALIITGSVVVVQNE